MKNEFLKTNYHSHTNFCDGANSAEEMVNAAIEKEFNIFGFSGHGMFPFGSDWHIQPKDYENYVKEINRLKTEYSDKIKILCGFEADFINGITSPDFKIYNEFSPDYLFGSVHYVANEKGIFAVDDSFKNVQSGVEKLFKGNFKTMVQEYFSAERKMLENNNFTFIGHPDLVRKHNEKNNFFNENDSWYKKELKATAKAIAKSGLCVEVNTGGISRGYISTPYPSPYFLELLHQYNVPVTVSSDTHSVSTVDFWFDQAYEYIKKAGYTELAFYTDGNYSFQKLY